MKYRLPLCYEWNKVYLVWSSIYFHLGCVIEVSLSVLAQWKTDFKQKKNAPANIYLINSWLYCCLLLTHSCGWIWFQTDTDVWKQPSSIFSLTALNLIGWMNEWTCRRNWNFGISFSWIRSQERKKECRLWMK